MTRPLCNCGNVKEMQGYSPYGTVMYRSSCTTCRKRGKRQKADKCSKCGFIPEDLVQLDVDHIDGNRCNNDPSNIQTLCANCHRLKTKQNMDWKKKNDQM